MNIYIPPSDYELALCWFENRWDTARIASHFGYEEHNVERRLWRIREHRRG